MNLGLRLMDWLDARVRARPGNWDERDRAFLRSDRVPDGWVGDTLVRPVVELIFGKPARSTTTRDVTVPGAAGPLLARVSAPLDVPDDMPVVLHLHGGGWSFGAPVQYDWWCTQIAAGLGAVVVSLDYRLAPEHPAPAAVEDVTAVAAWLLDQGGAEQLGATGAAAVVGDSAGGNLATLVAIDRRDVGDDRLRAQWLVCPIVDLTCSAPSFDRLADAPFLDRGEVDATIAEYLDGMAPDDPSVSPWFADDLTGVAPALVQVAELDLLIDDGVRWARRLADSGVTTELSTWGDQPHVFTVMPGVTGAARAALREGVAFLSGQLAPAEP